MDFWLRSATLQIGGNRYSMDDLTFDFEVPFEDSDELTTATVNAYNLSANTRNSIKKGDPVIINAGYEGDLGVIFVGQVSGLSHKHSATEWTTKITATEALDLRPDGDAVNKLATFTLVTIVSSVSIVTAIINPDAFATMADLASYALIGHGHEISDIAGLQEILDDYGDEIDLLSDLISGDMPGGITFSADFATLSNVTIIDGVWNQTARLIEA